MNKFFIVACFFISFFIIPSRLFAQQFSQYNTGTLFESFENPAQRAFTPDSSRRIAFNLLIPNFSADGTLAGNAQAALKSRAFVNIYDDRALTIGQRNFNYVNINLNAYFFMLKLYTNLNGNQEIGISGQSRIEARGTFSDESVQILANNSAFANTLNTNLFNTNYSYQVYHQIGLSYREDLDKQLSFGIKLSALFGVVSNKLNITRSNIAYDNANDRAYLSLAGSYQASYEPGNFAAHDIIPTTRNPGASINLGVNYLTDDRFKLQFNLKDLGFIHWGSQSPKGDFDNTGLIDSISQPGGESRTAQAALAIVKNNSQPQSFTTHLDSKFEFSGSKSFLLNNIGVKYSPTLVLSKNLFYRDFTTAFVNHFQRGNLTGTLTGTYNDMHYFGLGLQFMVKSPNAEFFIGSDRVLQDVTLVKEAHYPGVGQNFSHGRYTGANIYLGFSFKFGTVIEHPINSSIVPLNDQPSFVKRFWQRLTKRED